VADVQQMLNALNSPVRREILALVWDDELPAGAIAAEFALSPPTISQHLGVLRDAGLVTMTADGTFRRYRAVRSAVERLQRALPGAAAKWTPADDIPEVELASASVRTVVIAQTELDVDIEQAFVAFTDADVYSRWLGVPVELENNAFSCTLEWGTRVRGRYEHVCPPDLIAIRWDFEDDNVPLPGAELPAYIRFARSDDGCRVEVQQLVDDDRQAHFMDIAWRLVLGRLKNGIATAFDERSQTPRPQRAKRKRSA
jgi:DNA-binding transcriptional ArsR family regulator